MSAMTMTDPTIQFGAAMAAYGLNPAEIIIDGLMHRFDCDDEKKGKKSGWYKLHCDGVPAGAFGSWKDDINEKWCGKSDQALTPIERTQFKERIEKSKQEAALTRLTLQAEAAKVCAGIMATALDATDDNPYCIAKGIKPYGLKEFKDKRTLIVPIRDGTGALTSLQFIYPDKAADNKRMKSHGKVDGCYCGIGGKPTDTMLICEGFATGASLHQATGYPVAVAFNAGNLGAVAKVMRAKFPDIRIIICADNDRFKSTGNTGVTKGVEAAAAVSGFLAVPVFKSDDGKPTDYNDLHQVEGIDAVKLAISAVTRVQPSIKVSPVGEADLPGVLALNNTPTGRMVNIRCGAAIKPVPITWLWNGWLPAGKLTILAGAAGTGKTTLALGLAATLTSGSRWPDGSHCRAKGNVLIWSSEDVADDTLVPRLIASGADMNRCYFIEGITENGESVPFDPAQDILDLHRAVKNIGGVSLLVIDPIVSAVAGDMHRANDVRRSLQCVVDFAEAHQCAVIGITHFAKGGAGKAPQDRVIGSQAFGALARMVLVAAKEEDGTRRVLARAKSNIAPDDGGVSYTLGLTTIDGGIEATHAVWEGVIEGTAREILGEVEHDENGGDSSRDDLERMLIDTLTDAGGRMATKALQAEIRDAGHSWDAAKRAKKSLGIEAVKASMGGAWMWCLSTAMPRREHEGSEGSAEKIVLPLLPSVVSALPSAVSSTVSLEVEADL